MTFSLAAPDFNASERPDGDYREQITVLAKEIGCSDENLATALADANPSATLARLTNERNELYDRYSGLTWAYAATLDAVEGDGDGSPVTVLMESFDRAGARRRGSRATPLHRAAR